MITALTSAGFGLAISAALVYVLLRFFVATPHAVNTTEAVTRHAFWTALIAFFASGTSGLANLWVNPPAVDTSMDFTTQAPTMMMHAAAPGLWLGIVYILGQFTWPRHIKPVRRASLEVRSIKSMVPKFLSCILLLCTMISTVLIIIAWNDPGTPDRVSTAANSSYEQIIFDGEEDQYGNPVDENGNTVDRNFPEDYATPAEAEAAQNAPQIPEISGTRPGTFVGPYLLGGLCLVLVGTLGAALVVVRRPPLDSLDDEDNAALRTIWVTRRLRNSTFVIASFSAVALSYLADGIRARAEWALPLASNGPGFDAAAQSQANALTIAGSIFMLVVIITVLACPAPRLAQMASSSVTDGSTPTSTYSKARDFLLLTHCIGIVVMLMAFFIVGVMPAAAEMYGSTSSDGITTGDPTRLTTMGSLTLAVLVSAASYLLLNLMAHWVIVRRVGTAPATTPRTRLLPIWFLTVLVLAGTVGLASVASFAVAAPVSLRPAAWWATTALIMVGALAWVLYRAAAHRGPLAGATAQEDTRARVLLAQRATRMFGGVSLLLSSLLVAPMYWEPSGVGFGESMYSEQDPSGFQILTLVLGIILCLLPAATAYPAKQRRTASVGSGRP